MLLPDVTSCRFWMAMATCLSPRFPSASDAVRVLQRALRRWLHARETAARRLQVAWRQRLAMDKALEMVWHLRRLRAIYVVYARTEYKAATTIQRVARQVCSAVPCTRVITPLHPATYQATCALHHSVSTRPTNSRRVRFSCQVSQVSQVSQCSPRPTNSLRPYLSCRLLRVGERHAAGQAPSGRSCWRRCRRRRRQWRRRWRRLRRWSRWQRAAYRLRGASSP